ncbi:MAG: hypothetical protein WB763_25155 [Terriglobia bacterium]|jgi:hypothetical protein
MNVSTVRRAASLAVGLIGAWSATLTAQVGAVALKSLQALPQVTASTTQHNRSVGAALDIRVRVANLTESDITLEKVEVFMPGEFLAAREGGSPPAQEPKPSSKLLHPGGVQAFLFTVPPGSLRWVTQWANPQLLAFVPGEYDVVVRTHFQVPPAGVESVDETLKVSFEPPLGVLVWGGVAGAVLLAAFVCTYRYLRQTPRTTLTVAILQALALAAGGAVSAAVAIILLDRLKGVELPVNVTVKDFYGGIVIGLFSYKIGDSLYTQFFGTATESPSPPTPPSPAPVARATPPTPAPVAPSTSPGP